jgi:hypothetical protein
MSSPVMSKNRSVVHLRFKISRFSVTVIQFCIKFIYLLFFFEILFLLIKLTVNNQNFSRIT